MNNTQSSIHLPHEIWIMILDNLSDYKDWLKVRGVCKKLKEIAEDNKLWKRYFLKNAKPKSFFQQAIQAMNGKGEKNSYFDVLFLAKFDLDTLLTSNALLLYKFVSKPEIQAAIINNDRFRVSGIGLISAQKLTKDLALTYVSKSGIVSSLSDEMKDDEDIIDTAISYNAYNFFHASNRLKGNFDLAIKASEQIGLRVLAYVSQDLRQNRDFVTQVRGIADQQPAMFAPCA